MAETFFLQYAAHSDFEDGIFVPFATQEEAERQAAYDLGNGVDPEYIERIFKAPYELPRFGWTRTQLEAAETITSPHLFEKQREKIATRKQILQRASKHQQAIINDTLEARANEILAVHEAIRSGAAFEASVPGNAYTVMVGGTATGAPAALAAATAKTLCMITTGAQGQPSITEIGISFDGVTASAVPILVELVSGTATTTGTVVAQTPKQLRGWPAQASISTGQITITAEPTVQLVNRKWLVTPNGGLFTVQFPMGREPTGIVTATTDAKTWSIRATAPAIVNAHAYIEFEE